MKEACKEAQFDWGRPAQHGIIEMSRSGAFDVVQVVTHVCSQGGIGHVRIMGGGILCRKALPDLPQQGKRETKLLKQQIVLGSGVKVSIDMESSVDRLPAQQEMAGCGGCSDSEGARYSRLQD